jgi:guanine nucleotide-binding protein subunit beta-2-like 1 protein
MLSQSPASSIVVPGTAEGTESNLCVRCVATLTGHTGYITSIAASPDGSLCASSSKDGTVRLWDLVSATCLYDIVCGSAVHQVAFCPTRFWLAAAAEQSVQIYNLETRTVIAELIPQSQSRRSRPVANSVAWALDGGTLYSGYTDNNVRVWRVGQLG